MNNEQVLILYLAETEIELKLKLLIERNARKLYNC